jgi:hypothetical protein
MFLSQVRSRLDPSTLPTDADAVTFSTDEHPTQYQEAFDDSCNLLPIYSTMHAQQPNWFDTDFGSNPDGMPISSAEPSAS